MSSYTVLVKPLATAALCIWALDHHSIWILRLIAEANAPGGLKALALPVAGHLLHTESWLLTTLRACRQYHAECF